MLQVATKSGLITGLDCDPCTSIRITRAYQLNGGRVAAGSAAIMNRKVTQLSLHLDSEFICFIYIRDANLLHMQESWPVERRRVG